MTLLEAKKYAKDLLANVPDRDVDAAWILCAVTGLSRMELDTEGARVLTGREEDLLNAILRRRQTREPLQYIFGYVPFYHIELKCDARALIPRDETALLCEAVVNECKRHGYKSLLDLCTGSGAIALACLYELPALRVCGSDISADALALAAENAKNLNLSVDWYRGDLFEPLPGKKFDCIVSNPPYVTTREMDFLEKELSFEPALALDGGADGLDFYRDIITESKEHLNPGGMLAFEIGYEQGVSVRLLMERAGYTDVTVTRDYAGLDRICIGFLQE